MNEAITAVVNQTVGAHGLDLDEISLGGGKHRLLRIVVDADGGVGIDTIGTVSRDISQALDADPAANAALGSGAYTLEVTSRGTDRPLVLPRHWNRNAGRLVSVTPVEGSHFTGRIDSAGPDAVTIIVDGDERTVSYSDIRTAVVQVELNRNSNKDG